MKLWNKMAKIIKKNKQKQIFALNKTLLLVKRYWFESTIKIKKLGKLANKGILLQKGINLLEYFKKINFGDLGSLKITLKNAKKRLEAWLLKVLWD